MPKMPQKDADGDYDAGRCSPTTRPQPHHATPHEPMKKPDQHHGPAHAPMTKVNPAGGAGRAGY